MSEEVLSLNVLVPITNALCFVVMQSTFFWFIASREVDRVIEQKAQVLTQLRASLLDHKQCLLVDALDSAVGNATERAVKEAPHVAADRRRKNFALLLRWMMPVGLGLLTVGFFFGNAPRSWPCWCG